MGKKKRKLVIDSDYGESDDSVSDLDTALLHVAKKNKLQQDLVMSSETTDSDEEWEISNKVKVVRREKQKPSNVKVHQMEDAFSESEEGELSSDSNSDEAISQLIEFNDGFDENLMGDEEDRAKLAQMTEKQREQELFKRAERREIMKSRFEIEQKLRMAKQALTEKQKRIALFKTDKQQQVEINLWKRKKYENESNASKMICAIDQLKARRKEKKEKDERRKNEETKENSTTTLEDLGEFDDSGLSCQGISKLKMSEVYSDEESGPEFTNPTMVTMEEDNAVIRVESAVRSSENSSITDVKDLAAICLTRSAVETFLHLPFFDKLVNGCFVKIGGGKSTKGRRLYQICEVVGVIEMKKWYHLGKIRTNKGFVLRLGSSQRSASLEFLSNRGITEQEFSRWKHVCNKRLVPLPTYNYKECKIKELKEAGSYEFTEDDIEQILKEKSKFDMPTYNYAMKKTILIKERDVAFSRGDEKEVSKIEKKLQRLEREATEIEKIRTSSLSTISYINSRNRKKNVEQAEKAIMEEIQTKKHKKSDDPFTRRRTKPTLVCKTRNMDADAMFGDKENEKQQGIMPDSRSIESNTCEVSGVLFDPYSAHDFEIDIDLSRVVSSDYA